MADEHDKWLDREAAERLLRGEPLEAVAHDDARRARRLSAALDALTAVRSGPSGELPGEEAALKAFREARAVSAVDSAVTGATGAAGATAASGLPTVSDGGHGAAGRSGRSGKHRAGVPAGPAGSGRGAAGGPRWGRPVRFGLAAAVAACMVGGVAVAAGTGVLPSPFGGRDDPAPAASVSAAASPDEPLVSPSTSSGQNEEALPGDDVSPDGSSGSPDPDHNRSSSKDDRAPVSPDPWATETGRGGDALRRQIIEGCVKYRSGRLSGEQRRLLRESMKRSGATNDDLGRLCERVLGQTDDSGSDPDSGNSDGKNDGKNGGQDGDEDDDSSQGGSDQNAGYYPSVPRPSLSYSVSPELPSATPRPSASASAPASPSATPSS
ncbi:hypothetical protein ACIBL6_42630 [Streptomyces sp. NPDC050400]|uniref:hypothetical protein n=1 Tax=Streptomyces sp. NPDC050400 TaxID=3365610 RepID=UPI0037B2C5CF